jgi:hypothetical protein
MSSTFKSGARIRENLVQRGRYKTLGDPDAVRAKG